MFIWFVWFMWFMLFIKTKAWLNNSLPQHYNITNIKHYSDTITPKLPIDQIQCLLSAATTSSNDDAWNGCPTAWDGASCWTNTPSGQLSIIPCFTKFNGVLYNTTQNSSRMCLSNGTWADIAYYDNCKPLQNTENEYENLKKTWDAKGVAYIYYFGYSFSLAALTVALWIFIYFRDLRCVRNTIHTNLMITYMLISITWIITDSLHSNPSKSSNQASCVLVILLTYLMGTNFFWMFVEGLYLYILVVRTFSIELVKVRYYFAIGWGSPACIVVIWTIVKINCTDTNTDNDADTDDKTVFGRCPWQVKDLYDYIFICPIILVLLINTFFLIKIMWVLIAKLTSTQSFSRAEKKQYRKAAKALVVLVPLLGIAYMLVLVTPPNKTLKLIFQYAQAFFVSTQGFSVAVLYCFLNGEVRNSVRHHLERFKLRRTLRSGQYPVTSRNTSTFHSLRNGSNNKLYRTRGGDRDRDRGSFSSCSTTTTYMCNNSHTARNNRPTNGSTMNAVIYGPIGRHCAEDIL